MISKFYDKNIVEKKGFLVFSVILVILVRVIFFSYPKLNIEHPETWSYLWTPIASFFRNTTYSIIVSSIALIIIAYLANHINTKHAYIRRRTLMPPAVAILLFSCLPQQLLISPAYIAAIAILLIVNMLFAAYDEGKAQEYTYKSSFYLSFASLFAPVLLFYFPILWLCLTRIRCFSLKAFLASLFSIFIVYAPAFSYYLFTQDIDSFVKPFLAIGAYDWSQLPILRYELSDYCILSFVIILLIIVLVDNSMSSFKDKIRVRAFTYLLTALTLFSILLTLFVDIDVDSTLAIALGTGSLQIAHFFSLAENRSTRILFIFYLLLYLVVCSIPLLRAENIL